MWYLIKDFMLFSLIESLIFCFYFKTVWGIKDITFKEKILIALINCIISKTIPPILYQIIMTVFMSCYLFMKKDIPMVISFVQVSIIIIITLLAEMAGAMIYENIFNGNIKSLNDIGIFMLLIPIRFIEILMIKGGVKMKVWLGEIVKHK